MEEFKRLLMAFAGEVIHSYHSARHEDLDSYKNLLRYFEQRTQRPLDWVKLSQQGPDLRKVFEAGRGSEHWRVDLTDLSDAEGTERLQKIHPSLFCNDGFPHVPAEAVAPAAIYAPPPSFRGGWPITERRPFRCPICNGIGFEGTRKTPCRACKGAYIVWG